MWVHEAVLEVDSQLVSLKEEVSVLVGVMCLLFERVGGWVGGVLVGVWEMLRDTEIEPAPVGVGLSVRVRVVVEVTEVVSDRLRSADEVTVKLSVLVGEVGVKGVHVPEPVSDGLVGVRPPVTVVVYFSVTVPVGAEIDGVAVRVPVGELQV